MRALNVLAIILISVATIAATPITSTLDPRIHLRKQ